MLAQMGNSLYIDYICEIIRKPNVIIVFSNCRYHFKLANSTQFKVSKAQMKQHIMYLMNVFGFSIIEMHRK